MSETAIGGRVICDTCRMETFPDNRCECPKPASQPANTAAAGGKRTFNQLFELARKHPAYELEGAILSLTEDGDDRPLVALKARVEVLEAAIRKHRDQHGDDRCWMDDEELYRTLPEGFTPPQRDTAVELELCKKFIQCRHNPAIEYVSPQRRIEALENALREIRDLFDGSSETTHRTYVLANAALAGGKATI